MYRFSRLEIAASIVFFGAGSMASCSSAQEMPLVASYALDSMVDNQTVDSGTAHLNGTTRNVQVVVGKVGSAFSFGDDSAITIPNKDGLSKAGAALTLTAWINPREFRGNSGFIAKRDGNVAAPFVFLLGDGGQLGFNGYNGLDWITLFSEAKVPLNQWSHVAATFKAGDKLRLYINGQQVAEQNVGGALATNDHPLVIGRDAFYGQFRGSIDEVNIYAASLSPEQVQADMNGNIATRAVLDADFPPPSHVVKAALVRYDMPIAFTEGYGRTRQTAQRMSGPDAVDWPQVTWKGETVFAKSGEETLMALLRDGDVSRPLFQQQSDEVLQPGNHWFRPVQWMWGQRYVYTTDRTARSWSNDYELWTFPVRIQGSGDADVRDVVLKMDGQTIYSGAGPFRSLTLLLPQNENGKQYELTVAGRPSLHFNAGLQPIIAGEPRDTLIPLNLTVPGTGPKITVQNLERPQVFPQLAAWESDLREMRNALAPAPPTDVLKARLNAAAPTKEANAPLLLAYYGMEPDLQEGQHAIDLGPLKLNGTLENDARFYGKGQRDNALYLNSNQARVVVPNAEALDKTSDEMTLAAWIRLEQLPRQDTVAYIASKRTSWSQVKPWSLRIASDGNFGFEGHSGDAQNGTWQQQWADKKITIGEWHHVAFTYKADGDLVLYLDGEAVKTTKAYGKLTSNQEPLVLGYEQGGDFPGGGRSGFGGLMDEVQIFGTALSLAQIKASMAGQLAFRAPEGVTPQVRQIAVAVPINDGKSKQPFWKPYLGLQVPRSPVSINAVNLPHGMSAGFFYTSLHTPDKDHSGGGTFAGSPDEYARYMAQIGYDRTFEDLSETTTLNDSTGARSVDAVVQALAKQGVQFGLVPDTVWKRPFLGHPNVAFFSNNLPDWHAPLYRNLQLSMQRLGRYGNLAGASIGADNGAYVSFWDWAPPIPNRPWGEAYESWTKGKTSEPIGKSVGGQATAKEFVDYIERYNQTYKQYSYFSKAVTEIAPGLRATTGSFGSAPGVGARGGWPWASVPGKEMFEGMDVQQAYDWDETDAAKPMINVALVDRLKSYHPDKTTWTVIDDFLLKHSREARQRSYALALTRGIQGIGTEWLALPSGQFARPKIVEEQKELYDWIRKYGGAYAKTSPDASVGILFVQPQALLRRVNQNYNVPDEELFNGSHEGKTTEALFFAHAAGWPAKIITPDELKRGLPSGMKAIMLVGLNEIDSSWHWYDGLQNELQKFVTGGGRLLLDDESVLPPNLTGVKTGMRVRSYIVQGANGTSHGSMDLTPELLRRNADNIAKLRQAMQGVAPPVAASIDETIWAVPHTTGDVQYVTVVNQGSIEGKSATKFVKPQSGQLSWTTERPIYDVRTARKLSPEQAKQVDLTKDGFHFYALPPAAPTAPQTTVALGSDGFYEAMVSTGATPMRGVPVQITVSQGGENATVYGATGTAIELPLRSTDAGNYIIATKELLSNLNGETTLKVAAGAIEAPRNDAMALTAFANRKSVPLVVALTPEQQQEPAMQALAKKLVNFYTKRGRTATLRSVEPNDVVLSQQPLHSIMKYPQWTTIDADLVLLGNIRNNLLILDQARGLLLPNEPDGQDGNGVHLTYSPFVGECQVVNILGTTAQELTAGVNSLVGAQAN